MMPTASRLRVPNGYSSLGSGRKRGVRRVRRRWQLRPARRRRRALPPPRSSAPSASVSIIAKVRSGRRRAATRGRLVLRSTRAGRVRARDLRLEREAAPVAARPDASAGGRAGNRRSRARAAARRRNRLPSAGRRRKSSCNPSPSSTCPASPSSRSSLVRLSNVVNVNRLAREQGDRLRAAPERPLRRHRRRQDRLHARLGLRVPRRRRGAATRRRL